MWVTLRGELIHNEALIQGLNSGQIALAALDVFKKEPPLLHDPLINHEKVVVTPNALMATEDHVFIGLASTGTDDICGVAVYNIKTPGTSFVGTMSSDNITGALFIGINLIITTSDSGAHMMTPVEKTIQ